ncbi:aromatic prenyltransferase, partial [Diaporthe sp. PMI_573]
MSWLRTQVFPILARADPKIPSLCSPNGCPIEPSVNFTSNGTVVRFTMEPLALQGTDLDHREVVSSIQPLLAGAAGVDTRWFEQLVRTVMITPREEAELKGSLPPHLPRPQRYFLGFDLTGDTRNVKGYVFPPPVVRSGKIVPSATRVFNAVRSLDPFGEKLSPAVDELESFLHSLSIPWSVQLVSMDLRDPVQGLLSGNGSRIKIYVATAENSWSVVRNAITLGGRRKDHTTLEGLDRLADIWHLLLDEPDGILD